MMSYMDDSIEENLRFVDNSDLLGIMSVCQVISHSNIFI